MKQLLLGLALLITCGFISPTGGNLIQLKMIKKMTGKTIMNYINYGCYCGCGGQGLPLDATDWCCQSHDCCYSKIESKHCSPKLSLYKYSIRKGQIYCGGSNQCKRQSCQCDKEIALCLCKELYTYNSRYQWYKRSQCKDPTPPCSSLKS
ncbi:basic phospholipase A2 APC-D49-like [Dromiciops gliroides]|uniref:basic phospholipase A2 APC-D49-like n=1 Tax=Dromiciops gliroides TaxID=33562 RepID=UPI001CC6ABC5|nr:basic phospholipase A2 APC-D49-like [Dromiciops gliroides]